MLGWPVWRLTGITRYRSLCEHIERGGRRSGRSDRAAPDGFRPVPRPGPGGNPLLLLRAAVADSVGGRRAHRAHPRGGPEIPADPAGTGLRGQFRQAVLTPAAGARAGLCLSLVVQRGPDRPAAPGGSRRGTARVMLGERP